VTGDNLGRAVITVRRAGEINEEFLIMTLNDATISSISSSGNAGTDRMSEQVTFSFSSISGEYIQFDRNGSVVGTFDYNFAANKKK